MTHSLDDPNRLAGTCHGCGAEPGEECRAGCVIVAMDTPSLGDIPCETCGAFSGEECRDSCIAAPALAAEFGDDDLLAESEEGRLALVLARDLRTAGLPGNPRATFGAGRNVMVVLSHTSGRDWIVASVEMTWSGPLFYIARFADSSDDLWVQTRDAHEVAGAARAITDLAAAALI
ncbi:hypothetical protein [Cellulomonas sp. HD19AZ1]|uniref:hypothetical protein n=1 Tax=Cellulomonas sp. HD19AZ1 TaxID=2559593 RepID=UPI00107132D3|nr:hypothetical protein [Cellulomonas sp. HD19AZ1]TFH68143.1 hypothetical protein E4A51_18025 [Cellulomonas sp. HD19AZ1]